MQIGFIGLGKMGGPMAVNLIEAGFELNVHDLDPAQAQAVITKGATWAETAAQTAEAADIVLTSLPGPADVAAVALGEHGILAHMRPDAILIETSTNNLEVSHQLCDAAATYGVEVLDAPVTGGTEGAAAGDLTVLVGGSKDAFERCLPVFRAIGTRIEHLGPAGAGYVAKIAQVVLCYIHSLALSEALMLGVKGGVDADKMLSIIQDSAGQSYAADRYGPAILRGDYDPSFALGLAYKDMRLTMELAETVNAALPLCELVQQTYEAACDSYGGDANHLTAVRLLEEANQTYLRAGTQAGENPEDQREIVS